MHHRCLRLDFRRLALVRRHGVRKRCGPWRRFHPRPDGSWRNRRRLRHCWRCNRTWTRFRRCRRHIGGRLLLHQLRQFCLDGRRRRCSRCGFRRMRNVHVLAPWRRHDGSRSWLFGGTLHALFTQKLRQRWGLRSSLSWLKAHLRNRSWRLRTGCGTGHGCCFRLLCKWCTWRRRIRSSIGFCLRLCDVVLIVEIRRRIRRIRRIGGTFSGAILAATAATTAAAATRAQFIARRITLGLVFNWRTGGIGSEDSFRCSRSG